VILTTPDAPINFTENIAIRTSTSIGLQWTIGVQNGGANVTDFRLSYSVGVNSNVFTIIQSGITAYNYNVTGLTTGVTYQFRIEAHNAYGYSSYS